MKSKWILAIVVFVTLTGFLPTPRAVADTPSIGDVTRAIQQKNARWSARETTVSQWSQEERKRRLGSRFPNISLKENILTALPLALPEKLDWRNYNGISYVTPVKDQGACNACWAFATTAALESRVLITKAIPDAAIDLSEQLLTACGRSGDCEAGYINTASDYLSNYGLPSEACYPYIGADGLCADACPNWENDAYRISGWSLVQATVEAIKSALYSHGPLVTLLAVQGDFFYYDSGIYSHSQGSFEGYHAALIVGYDDVEKHFIVKSSWGTDWGEAGYFRIAYSEINSETRFGSWTIAYEGSIPSFFPILDNIPRVETCQTCSQSTDQNPTEGTGRGHGRYALYQDDGATGNGTAKEDKKHRTEKSTSQQRTIGANNLPAAGLGDPLTINGPNQMSINGTQTLTVSGGCEVAYTWAIVRGGGSLSGNSGTSVTYYAPAQNQNCQSNATIRCLDSCGQSTEILIAINNPSAPGDATLEYTADCFQNLPPGTPTICGDVTPVEPAGAYYFGCSCLYVQSCNGTTLPRGTVGGMWSWWTEPDYCTRGACQPNPRTVDVRSSESKAAGCCAASLAENDALGGSGSLGKGYVSDAISTCPTDKIPKSPNIPSFSEANLTSGNLYFSLEVGGLTLSFNSIDSYNGPLGPKWTHNFNESLTAMSDNSTLKFKANDGNFIYFRLSGSVYYPEAISGDSSQIVKNGDNTYTRTLKNGFVHRYNTLGRLISITDRNGNATTLTYSGNNLTSITDPNGRTTTFTSSWGAIVTITDPGGRTYTLSYASGSGRLTSVAAPLGNTWQYSYDGNGQLVRKTDPAGRQVNYTYDTQGRLLTATDPETKTKTMAYTQSGTTTLTEKDGGVWTYNYDPTFKVKTQKTDPLGNVTKYKYDLKRNLISVTDPALGVTSYTYDANGNRTSETDPLNQTTSYTYNSLNLVATMTDPKGAVTTYGYDARGNLTSIAAPIGTTAFQYDAKGNVNAVIDPNSRTTTFGYDTQNNLMSITDPLGNTTDFTYDAAGNRLTMTDPLGQVTSYAYNALNQMIQVTDPNGNVIYFTYDYEGNVLSTTDANGRPTQYAYNYRGQLTQITDALSQLTQLTYGPASCGSGCGGAEKLTALTDALSHTTQYNYDLAGRLTGETDPQAKTTSYTYDAKGNVLTRTKPDGHAITYTYDAANRLTQKQYADGSITQYQYDANGNLTYAGNVAIAYNFVYDASNRLTSVTDSNSRTIQYQYNASGQRISVTTPENRTIGYGYDSAGRLGAIATDSRTFSFGYDNASRRNSLTLPNGTAAAYTYDNNGNLTRVRHTGPGSTLLAEINYTYDGVNNRLSRADGATSSLPTAGTDTLTYGTANELLTLNATTYSYDLNGNRSQKTEGANGTTYSYDDENRLVRLETTGGQVSTYVYDPFGRRIEKNVNGQLTRYLYDGEDILLEYDSAGAVIARYIHGPGIDEPLALEKGSQHYYYHADGLGSIVALSGSTGAVAQAYQYDAFGNISISTPTLVQPYTYTAREYDPETGLYFFRERTYDPVVGRFLQRDPIGFNSVDVNLYAYVLNNSLNRIDPFGLYNEDVHYYYTLEIALEIGMTPSRARMIALADNKVDQKYNPLFSQRNREEWHFITLPRVSSLLESATSLCNDEAFGESLHVLQDYFSHTLQKFGPIRGHADEPFRPDIVFNNPKLYEQMLAATVNALQRYKNKCDCH